MRLPMYSTSWCSARSYPQHRICQSHGCLPCDPPIYRDFYSLVFEYALFISI